MSMTTITIKRGDDIYLDFSFADMAGSPIALGSKVVFFTVKESIDDSDDAAIIAKTISSFDAPATGSVSILLSNADTNSLEIGRYKYDVQLKDTTTGSIQTPAELPGTFVITADVTRRIE